MIGYLIAAQKTCIIWLVFSLCYAWTFNIVLAACVGAIVFSHLLYAKVRL